MKAWLICVWVPFFVVYLPALWLWLKLEERNDRKRETDARVRKRN